jgi:hypothetical protein
MTGMELVRHSENKSTEKGCTLEANTIWSSVLQTPSVNMVIGVEGVTVPVDKILGRSTAAVERDLVNKKLLAPWVLLGDATSGDLDSLDKAQELINFKVKNTIAVVSWYHFVCSTKV